MTTTTATLKVTGMVCGGCENHVREALEQLRGVRHASVSARGGLAIVEYDGSSLSQDDLIAVVERAGYGASTACDTIEP